MFTLLEGILSVLLYIFEKKYLKSEKKTRQEAEREMEGEGLFMWM